MRYLRRFVWYIASRLFIVLILIGILTVTFYYAMNATNIYVVIKDGMARRAQVIMMDEPLSSLNTAILPIPGSNGTPCCKAR